MKCSQLLDPSGKPGLSLFPSLSMAAFRPGRKIFSRELITRFLGHAESGTSVAEVIGKLK
jgi:hypothetical protein